MTTGVKEASSGIVDMVRYGAIHANVLVQPLRRDVSVILEGGGNIGVLSGAEGNLLVDSGLVEASAKIKAALRSINGHPLKHLINTHWHFDHTGGNKWMHVEGATIIGHENTRKHLSVATRVEGWDYTFPAELAGALPTITVNSLHMQVNGAAIAIEGYGPAHTDSDLSVHFREADIFFAGDTWWNGVYPFIDYSTGGSIDGMIRSANANVAKAGAKTIVVPGHGPVGDREQLAEYRDVLSDIREKVAALKKRGKSLEETIAARPTAAHDGKWGGFVITGAFFTRLVYQGV